MRALCLYSRVNLLVAYYVNVCPFLLSYSLTPSLHSIQLVADTAQLAKLADSSIKKLKVRSRTFSPVS